MTDGIFILLGSNIGDQITQLSKARTCLDELDVRISQASSVYRSEAWGPVSQPDFANQVLRVTFDSTPEHLMTALLTAESKLGRTRKQKWGPRTIDIDLLYYNQEILDTPTLRLPHPEIINRRFTLRPLVEIAPDFIHPGNKKTQALLLKQCPDTLGVDLWT